MTIARGKPQLFPVKVIFSGFKIFLFLSLS